MTQDYFTKQCPICYNNDPIFIKPIEKVESCWRVSCKLCECIYFDREPPERTLYNSSYNLHFFRPGDISKAGIMAAKLAWFCEKNLKDPWVLEAGVGNGLTVFLLKLMGINAYGIDIDPIWCRYLEQKFNIVVLPTRLESYKYSITPDLIYSSHTIEHTESPRLFLQKCLQIASPDAFLYLDTPDTYYQEKTGNRWHHLETRTPFEHLCLLSERSLEILCQQTGWQLVWFARFLEFQSFQAILQKKGKGL